MSGSASIAVLLMCITFSVCAATELNDDEIRERYRRKAEDNCEQLVTNNLLCVKNVSWNLEVMLKSPKCMSLSSNKTLESLCIEEEICGGSCSLENIDEKSTCHKKPELWKKLVLLKLLCSHRSEGISCARVLFNAYNVSDSSKLKQLNTTSGRCCIASLMKVYNSSGNVTELLPQSWKKSGLPIPKECLAKALSYSTAIPLSTVVPSSHEETTMKSAPSSTSSKPTRKITTQSHMAIEKGPSDKMSSRLKASLVIASIIFFVVAVIVGRYFYHRVQRKRRAKYEDYGYSQLKIILEDNLYEDEEDDDDQLLSAT